MVVVMMSSSSLDHAYALSDTKEKKHTEYKNGSSEGRVGHVHNKYLINTLREGSHAVWLHLWARPTRKTKKFPRQALDWTESNDLGRCYSVVKCILSLLHAAAVTIDVRT